MVSNTTSIQSNANKINGAFVHTVLFWLKNADNKEDCTLFESVLNDFISSNPQISSYHVGTPAATEREVVDNSYTYCLVVTFPDVQTHDGYQVDPTHLLFIEKARHLWNKVVIYDSLAITK